jgi:hypothetical protein
MYDRGPTCPVCAKEISPSGPGVSSWSASGDTTTESRWVPFVEDLRGTPQRLVHVTCFVDQEGLSALIALLHERDIAERMREFRRWQHANGITETG